MDWVHKKVNEFLTLASSCLSDEDTNWGNYD